MLRWSKYSITYHNIVKFHLKFILFIFIYLLTKPRYVFDFRSKDQSRSKNLTHQDTSRRSKKSKLIWLIWVVFISALYGPELRTDPIDQSEESQGKKGQTFKSVYIVKQYSLVTQTAPTSVIYFGLVWSWSCRKISYIEATNIS